MANLSSDNIIKKSVSRLTQFFNVYIRELSYGKLVRSSLFILLALSIATNLFVNPTIAAIVSLISFISFDIICLFKKPKIKDHTETIIQLQEQNKDFEQKLKEVKGDISVVKVSAGFSGRK